MTKTNKKRYPFKLATNRIMLTNLYAAKLNGEPVHVMKIDLKLTRMTDSDFLKDALTHYKSLRKSDYDYIKDADRKFPPKEVSLVYTFKDRRHMDDSDDAFLPDGEYMRIFPLDNQDIIDENNKYFNTQFESEPNDRTFFEDFTDLEEIFYYNDLSMYTSITSNTLKNMLTLVSYYEAGGLNSGIAKKIKTVKLHVSKSKNSNGALLLDFYYPEENKSFLRDEACKFIDNAIELAKERMDIDDSSYDTILDYTATDRRPDLPIFEADKILNLCFKLKEITGKDLKYTVDELIIKKMIWLNSKNTAIPFEDLFDIIREMLNMLTMFNGDDVNHPCEGIVFDMNEYTGMDRSLVPETVLGDTNVTDLNGKIKVPCGFTLYKFNSKEDKERILPFLNNGWNIDYRKDRSMSNLHLLTYLKENFKPSGTYTGLTRCKNVSRSRLSGLLNGKASEIFLSY